MSTLNETNKMRDMRSLGADWWNDSCDLQQLAEAVANGATGATSNPVIVEAAVEADQERWLGLAKQIADANPDDQLETVVWKLIAEMGRQAAEILYPVYKETKGAKGYLSLQVNPTYHLDSDKMLAQAKELASIAPNITIKLPTTQAGLIAVEGLIAEGIPVNTTVSFSVAQAVAAAEAIQRGLKALEAKGKDPSKVHPYVTIMIGRVGDYLERIAERDQRNIEVIDLYNSGVFVFKKAAEIFHERGFNSTLLAAAYRHEVHWSRIIGGDVLQSIPYPWWKQFQASHIQLSESLWEPEDEATLERLEQTFPEFAKVYQQDALSVGDFQDFEATQNTLQQFISGYESLKERVAKAIDRP